jgi:hypothetical protein
MTEKIALDNKYTPLIMDNSRYYIISGGRLWVK